MTHFFDVYSNCIRYALRLEDHSSTTADKVARKISHSVQKRKQKIKTRAALRELEHGAAVFCANGKWRRQKPLKDTQK